MAAASEQANVEAEQLLSYQKRAFFLKHFWYFFKCYHYVSCFCIKILKYVIQLGLGTLVAIEHRQQQAAAIAATETSPCTDVENELERERERERKIKKRESRGQDFRRKKLG
jgi:hypothetical protein